MIAVITWIVRILIVLLLVRLVLRWLFGDRGIVRRRPRAPLERAGGALVRDPHCGTYLPKTRALTLGTGRTTEYFCSTACRDAYAVAHRK